MSERVQMVLFSIGAGIMLAVGYYGCGGSGGSASNSNPSSGGLPAGCVEVGSIANTGGDIQIVANCISGSPGTSSQQCFATGAGGNTPVPVPCDNGGAGQVIGSPTPVA